MENEELTKNEQVRAPAMPAAPDSDAPSMPLPHWLSKLYKDDKAEEVDYGELVIQLMPLNIREIVWYIAKDLLGRYRDELGVASQACYILERYSATFAQASEMVSHNEWQGMQCAYKSKIIFLIGVSVMLASKIDTSKYYISTEFLKQGLRKFDNYVSTHEINSVELEMYKITGPRVPVWSNIQKAQMFIMELNLPPRIMITVSISMTVIDIELPSVYDLFIQHASASCKKLIGSLYMPPNCPFVAEGRVRNIHLVAGVVLATCMYVQMPTSNIILPLANWSRTTVAYLRWASIVVHQYLMIFMSKRYIVQQSPTPSNSEEAIPPCPIQ